MHAPDDQDPVALAVGRGGLLGDALPQGELEEGGYALDPLLAAADRLMIASPRVSTASPEGV